MSDEPNLPETVFPRNCDDGEEAIDPETAAINSFLADNPEIVPVATFSASHASPSYPQHADPEDGDLTDHEYETDHSVYENRGGLADDMKFLASMPELCDVTFLVGETREPVCAVKAVLGARSRVFQKLLYKQPNAPGSQPNSALQPSTTSVGGSSSASSRGDSEVWGSEEVKSVSESRKSSKSSKRMTRKDTVKDTKLKLFLKRGSEPILNGLPFNQQPTVQTHQTMIIEEFEPDVFRQLIEYIHTGCVTLQARTLLGLMNAADYYGLEELRKGCIGFVSCCITVDTVCALLASAERYIQYKCTKSLVQRVLEYVDHHGNEVLSLGSFALLPEHVVRLILSREELNADELTKFMAAFNWSQRYCDASPGTSDLREIVSNFFECIEFYKIPATVLMREVHPLGVVPDHVVMNALAFQADPHSVDFHKIESPSRFRRMTLPHTLNIAGSDLLSLRQSTPNFKSERSASTSTSGYASIDSNHSKESDKNKKKEEKSKEKDDKEGKEKGKEKKDKLLSKRRASRPFRRAMTLLDSSR